MRHEASVGAIYSLALLLFSEYVRNLKNLKKYNCDEKLEFIKKGMGKTRDMK